MKVFRSRLILRSLLIFGLAVLGRAAPAETPGRMVLSYELWKGGFHAVDFDAAVLRAGDRYSIDFVARTRGIVGWIYPYVLHAETQGMVEGAELMPRRFVSQARSRGDERRRAIEFLPNGRLRPDPVPDDVGLSEALLRGAADPASAIFSIVDRIARSGRCDGTFPVFDGKRRYDLALSPGGPDTLGASRYALYSGPAERCRVTVSPLAGFRDKKGRVPPVIDVWLAPVLAGRPAVPVRLEGTNDLGGLVVHLVGARAGAAAQAER